MPSLTNTPMPGCPGLMLSLPSYWLFDSILDSTAFQDQPDNHCGLPSTDASITYANQVPKARLVTYPWAYGYHYAIRDWLSFSQIEIEDYAAEQAATWGSPARHRSIGYAVDIIGSQTGLDPHDVPLALFSGLVSETDLETITFTDSEQLFGDAWKNAVLALSDLVLQNYMGAVKQAVGGAIEVSQEAQAQPNTINRVINPWGGRRAFQRMTDPPSFAVQVLTNFSLIQQSTDLFNRAFGIIKNAHDTGSSIAAALDNVASITSQSQHFQMLAALHRDNEMRAIAAVNDPLFVEFAKKVLLDPVGNPLQGSALMQAITALRAAWLRDAGAPLSGQASTSPSSSQVNSSLLNDFRRSVASGAFRINPVGFRSAQAPMTIGTDGTGDGTLIAVGVAALAAGFLIFRKRRKR